MSDIEFLAGASSFSGEVAAELRAMAGSGTICVIDVLVLIKDADGTVEATEPSDGSEAVRRARQLELT